MDRKTGIATALFVAVSFLFHGPTSGANSERPIRAAFEGGEHTASTPAGTEPAPEMGPWTPLCKYFETGETPPLATQSPSDTESSTKQFCIDPRVAPLYDRTVLIATVPDPELTHLSMVFDRYIESIIWAAVDGDLAGNRYIFNSYWFPWRPDLKQETDLEKLNAAERDRERRVSTPGILLFRGTRDPRKLLLIFLVGETPTSGVNRVSFLRAQKYARELRKGPGLPVCGGAECDAILGPSFTGSLDSLDRLLNPDAARPPPARQTIVISGSVTGAVGQRRDRLFPAHFCTTIEQEDHRQAALLKYLGTSVVLADPPLLAYLREDETAYGEGPAVRYDTLPKGPGSPLTLRFPRGIARIRNLAGELPGLNTLGQPSGRYPELPLDLRDTGQDTIPSFGRQTPVSQEGVMLDLVAALKREHIRYAAIIATDPLDALFLSRSIRTLAPNVRLVVFHSDVLFARAAAHWGLDGILAIASYPLISRNQYYERATRPRRTQFANESAEGEYNALRRMLLGSSTALTPLTNGAADPACNSDPHVAGDRSGDNRDYLLDYSNPFAGTDDPGHSDHRPPVWITVLGHDAWWPVAVYPASGPGPLLKGPPPGSHAHENFTVEESPHIWAAFFWIVLAACAAHVFLIFALNCWHVRFLWLSGTFRTFAWDWKSNLLDSRRAYVAGTSLAVAGASFSLAFASVASGLANRHYYADLIAAGLICIAAIAEAFWARSQWKVWLLVSGIGIAIALATGAAVTATGRVGEGHLFELAGYRAVHLESGASPLPPLMLLLGAVYLWFWTRLHHLRMQEDRTTRMPSCPKLIVSESDPPRIDFVHLAVAILAIVCWLVFLSPWRSLATVDGSLYSNAIVALSTLVVGMLALSTVHFLRSWQSLHGLLQDLERHPIRYSFSRYPKDFKWTTVWTGDPRPKLHLPMRSLEVLRMIPECQTLIPPVEFALGFLKSSDRSFPLVAGHVHLLNNALNRALEKVADVLSAGWEKGICDTIASREKDDVVPPEWTADPSPVAREEFIVLRFVAFILYSLWLMRSTLNFVMYGFILLVAALTLYPFEGKRGIGIALVLIFVAIGIPAFLVFASMDRDPLLSRLSATKPNQLSLNFVSRMLSYGALPLLTLLASQVPEIGNFLLSWVQPALQSVK